ncbi:MAG TPA: helix-turn-helix transcriptional regulator [Candidatus Methylomirabilis sp.]|jgi:MerR family transcriptional regulator/heat shock protein HspR|nr:helix-turn-helix transcriptional regulator [Candidatus Methylomirabilis sp.]
MARNKRPRYLISVVADMFDVHPQTLRTYEREGLIRPARSQGNTRLYSDEDLARIELILRLTKELGVNLAGVEVILNMRERMERMQREMAETFETMLRTVEEELRQRHAQGPGLVPVGRRGLSRRIPVEEERAGKA